MVEHAQALGLDIAGELNRLGLQIESFTTVTRTVSLYEVDALIDAIVRISERDALGIDVGQRLRLGGHGMLGFGMAHCETLDQALRLKARFSHLVWPAFTLEYRRDRDEASFHFRPNAAMTPRVFRCIADMFAVSTYQHLTEILGEAPPPHDLLLWGERPAYARRFDILSRARIWFGCLSLPEVQFVLPGHILDVRLAGADRQAVRIAEHHCRKMESSSGPTGRWSDWVNLMLIESVGVQPSIERLADLLQVTPRTLNRHLADEGECFRNMSKRVRHDRACCWLATTDKPIAEIASQLGYGDIASFSHAFRAISGHSPRAFRVQSRPVARHGKISASEYSDTGVDKERLSAG